MDPSDVSLNPSSTVQTRESIVHALYNSLTDLTEKPLWGNFLRTVRDAFACDHAALIFASLQAPGKQPVVFCDDPASGIVVEALCQDGVLDGVQRQKVVKREFSPSDGGDVIPRVLLVSIASEEQRAVYLLLWRVRDEPFDTAEQGLLNSLLDHLTKAIKIFFQLSDLGRKKILLNDAIENADIGVILTDTEGAIKITNSVADDILSKGDGLKLYGGKLRANSAADTTLLLGQIKQQAAEQQAETDKSIYVPMALQRSNSALPITVIIRPGPAFRPLKYPLLRTAMLLLRDPERRPIIPAASLTRLFGLTRAESLLASELARGSSVEEAALRLGVTLNTARSQLRAVFIKTGSNRQGELVRLLLSSAAAMSA